MKIHPTALVDPGAQLGEGVEIGPYSVVGPQVVIGAGTSVQSHVVLEGAVQIGDGNFLGHAAIIGAPPQDLGFKAGTHSRIEIGHRNVIREQVTIHRGTAEGSATSVGDDNFLMAGAHLGHNARVGNRVIIANHCLLGGYVEIGDRAFLGGGAMFHQFVRVGRLAIVQGGAMLSKDVPPFLLASGANRIVGLNVVGLRRAGLTAAEREEIARAFALLFRSGLNTKQALEKASAWGGLGGELFDFVRAANKRGIGSHRRREI